MSLELINLHGGRKTPFIPQDERSECALACIAMVAGFHGMKTDVNALRRRFSISARGATLAQLMEIAEEIGFNARALRGEISELPHLTLPAILHWDLSHFVVLTRISYRWGKERFHVHDPARGPLVLGRSDFSKHFTGVAVDLLKSERFSEGGEKTKLRIAQLWSSIVGLWSTLGNVLALSLVMQLAALAMPFYAQIAIDTAFPAADQDLLKILAIGFLMLAVVTLVTTWIRSYVIVALNNALSYQVIVNLFRHLSRLPLAWFEKRHVGDIVSRFGSTAPISQLISQGMVAAFVDGIMSVFTICLMFIYSVKLALVALAALMVFVLLRIAFLHSLRIRNVDVITTVAKENSIFIETVRGIATIKAFGEEGNRQRLWQKSKADAINAQVKLGRIMGAFDALGAFVPAAERVIFIYIAVGLGLNGEMTLGMIFAYQAYKQQFFDAGIRLVEQAVNYKIIQVHLNRISDIALSAPERDESEKKAAGDPDIGSSISLRKVHFRYSMTDPEVLKGVSIDVKEGEMVVLVGPSGGGKTTLLKVMMGLLDPTHGKVIVGERPLYAYSRAAWRKSIGVVAQDDNLFAGSLADNIAFFDPQINMELVEEVSRYAKIHDEIMAMPLGYDTLVGDMGSVLSGGQKQRVLLARALYRKPKVLFLDEGTAHLDPQSEASVLASLASLDITRILVAHRTQYLESADKVILVSNGTAVPLPAASSPPSRPILTISDLKTQAPE